MKRSKIDNFQSALKSLEEAVALPIENDRDMAGIIQNFEFVYELSWKLLKAILEDEGQQAGSPKDVFSKAYQARLIDNEEIWLDIIKDRNLTVHTYNRTLANKIVTKVKNTYLAAFQTLRKVIPE